MVIRILSLCLVAMTLCLPSKAELILLEQSEKSSYELVDYDASQHKSDLDNIFKEILLKYQWPMITMYFHELPEAEQMEYLKFLEKPNGVEAFVNHKLEMLYKNKYRVLFIPNTIFEMAVINNFVDYTINSNKDRIADELSIFPENDLRNGKFAIYFNLYIEKRLLEGLKNFSHVPYAFMKAIKFAFEEVNMENGIKEQYFQTLKFLNQHIGSTRLQSLSKKDDNTNKVIEQFIDLYQKNKSNFIKKIDLKDKILFLNRLDPYHLDHNYLQSSDLPLLEKAISYEYDSAKSNHFILFRGTRGFSLKSEQVTEQKHGENSSPSVWEGKQVLIDNPSRNIVSGHSKITHPTLQKMLPIQPTIKETSPKKFFSPSSLSFGNSLLAGTFWDSGEGTVARALDFIRKSPIGYGISLPIKDYLNPDKTNLPLDKKYYISPLHTIAALWTCGEMFHSRTKVSFINPNDQWSGKINMGVADLPVTTLGFLLQDQGIRAGLLIVPDVPWNRLASEIAEDVVKNIIWIKVDPAQRKMLVESQNNAALFSALDLGALEKHFQKFQSVLPKIREGIRLKNLKENENKEDLGRTSEKKQEKAQEIASRINNPFKNLINLNSRPDNRKYSESNPFWKILQNPDKNLTTPKRFESADSLSFDDLRKRTKEHIIIIPKGKYISFSHFVDHASDKEILDYCRSIAKTAEVSGLDKTGYRIVSNHGIDPGSKTNNDANQEVPHFHVHLAGGECLGKPVEGSPLPPPDKSQPILPIDMSISKPPLGFGLSKTQVIQEALENKIAQTFIESPNKESLRLVAYKIKDSEDNIPFLLGFILLDKNNKSAFPSVQDFLKNAPSEVLIPTLKFINDVVKGTSLFNTGYRLFANMGLDAWQYPKDVMQFFLAGGNKLGVTVTNAWGNFLNSYSSWKREVIYDFDQLQQMPHNHCPIHPGDFKEFSDMVSNVFSQNAKNLDTLKNINNELSSIQEFLLDIESRAKSANSHYQHLSSIQKGFTNTMSHLLNTYKGHLEKVESTVHEIEKTIRNSSMSIDDTQKISNKLKEIGKSFNILSDFKSNLSKHDQSQIWGQEITDSYNIGPNHYSVDFSDTNYKWEFIELDGILTKGLYSTKPLDPHFIERINNSIKSGYKVIALTNRPYWENMDEDKTNKDHKDTFKLLDKLGIKFSNPGNLAPFSIDSVGSQEKFTSRFKDGVIFCPNQNKGTCIVNYLTRLADKGVDFPIIPAVYDTNQNNLNDVGRALENLKLPGVLNWVNIEHHK